MPVTDYKSFQGRITVKQKLSVDDKRLKTVIVKGLRRIYYKKFYTIEKGIFISMTHNVQITQIRERRTMGLGLAEANYYI